MKSISVMLPLSLPCSIHNHIIAGITEQLKSTDQLKWVELMNTVKAQMEEVIFAELIYC